MVAVGKILLGDICHSGILEIEIKIYTPVNLEAKEVNQKRPEFGYLPSYLATQRLAFIFQGCLIFLSISPFFKVSLGQGYVSFKDNRT